MFLCHPWLYKSEHSPSRQDASRNQTFNKPSTHLRFYQELKCSPKPPSSSLLLSSPTPAPSLLRNVSWLALNLLSWHSSSTPIGCWTDNADRTLRDNFLQSVDMSTEVCGSFCKAYPIFGTENSMFLLWSTHDVRRALFWYLNSESMLLWEAVVWRCPIPRP